MKTVTVWDYCLFPYIDILDVSQPSVIHPLAEKSVIEKVYRCKLYFHGRPPLAEIRTGIKSVERCLYIQAITASMFMLLCSNWFFAVPSTIILGLIDSSLNLTDYIFAQKTSLPSIL